MPCNRACGNYYTTPVITIARNLSAIAWRAALNGNTATPDFPSNANTNVSSMSCQERNYKRICFQFGVNVSEYISALKFTAELRAKVHGTSVYTDYDSRLKVKGPSECAVNSASLTLVRSVNSANNGRCQDFKMSLTGIRVQEAFSATNAECCNWKTPEASTSHTVRYTGQAPFKLNGYKWASSTTINSDMDC